MRLTRPTIVLCSALALLTGCARNGTHLASTAIVAAEGQSFYLFRQGYQCGGPLPASPLLASWVDRIQVVEGKLVRWGSRCGGEGLPVPPAELSRLRLSPDGATLTLGDAVYRRSADPLKEAEARP